MINAEVADKFPFIHFVWN